MDALALILAASSTAFSILLLLLGWSLSRNVKHNDLAIEAVALNNQTLTRELAQTKLDHAHEMGTLRVELERCVKQHEWKSIKDELAQIQATQATILERLAKVPARK